MKRKNRKAKVHGPPTGKLRKKAGHNQAKDPHMVQARKSLRKKKKEMKRSTVHRPERDRKEDVKKGVK